jgi:aldose 1-epimerase
MKIARLLQGFYLLLVLALSVSGCAGRSDSDASANDAKPDEFVTRESFGTLPDGKEVYLFTITNGKGFKLKATNYGGIITSIIVPDKNGTAGDVVLGFDSLEQYVGRHPHMGPLIGRYSGYVANGKFSIDGIEYTLAKNSGANHLHGGQKAFDKVLWDAEEISNANGHGIALKYTSPEGEEGYPGNLKVKVSYVVTKNNNLEITYEARRTRKLM